MKLQTIRLRRSRPSTLSLALALLITMAFVYILSLSAKRPAETEAAATPAATTMNLRMEGMDLAFVCEEKCDDLLQARIAAANCAKHGGAGIILADGAAFAVIHEAVSPEDAPEAALLRSAAGLTLQMQGPAAELQAISTALDFLRAQATETASLPAALESGSTDAPSIAALLQVYQTQAARILEGLSAIQTEIPLVAQLQTAIQAAQNRLQAAIAAPDPGKLRLLHTAACGAWLELLAIR